jgi:hypothetical protein
MLVFFAIGVVITLPSQPQKIPRIYIYIIVLLRPVSLSIT